jgi:hypothetical protein
VQHFLRATRDYFTAVRPLVQCLAAYGDRFPNGLPIQDELSEIAISFARRDEADDVNTPQLDNDLQALVSNIVAEVADTPMQEQARSSDTTTVSSKTKCKARLQDSLSKYYSEYSKTPDGWISPDYERQSSADCENAFSAQAQKLGCRIWGLINLAREHWRSSWINGTKPPYRALFETYVITAAGYPQDAAYYIDDAFNTYKERGREDYGRLINWLFSLRILHARERMLEEAEDFIKQSEALIELDGEYDEFFRELVGTDKTGPLLDECRARWENAKLWKGFGEVDKRADVGDFLSKTLFFHMKTRLRRWQTQNKGFRAKLREIGDEFATVFADLEGSFEGCFRGWMYSLPEGKDKIGEQIDEMHMEFGLTAGAIKLVELLSLTERKGEYGKFSGQEERMILCSAQSMFEKVKDGLPGTEVRSPWQESAWERASKFSEAIIAWKPQC